MSKKSSQTYLLYPRVGDDIVDAVRKAAPKHVRKLPREQKVAEYFKHDPNALKSLVFPTLGEEWHWEQTSGMVLILENAALMENLYRARFDLESASHLKFPRNSFMLSVPQGTQVDGITLPAALVTWCPFDRMATDIYEPYGESLGLPKGKGTPNLREGLDPTLPGLTLVFQDPDHKAGRGRVTAHSDDLPAILNAESPGEILSILGNYETSRYEDVIRPNDTSLHIQARLLKIVVALAVYYTATEEDETLIKGMPGTKARFSRPKESFSRPFTLRNLTHESGDERKQVGVEITESTRRWHFRQLRHARYYQGKYEGMPPGSRIVFVSGAKVTRTRKIFSDDEMLAEADNRQTLSL